jgi:hypothetical protein
MMPTSVSISASSVGRVLGAELLSKMDGETIEEKDRRREPREYSNIGTSMFATLTLAAPSMARPSASPHWHTICFRQCVLPRGLQLVCMYRRSAKWREMDLGFFRSGLASGIGMLLAPKSGDKTRGLLKEKGGRRQGVFETPGSSCATARPTSSRAEGPSAAEGRAGGTVAVSKQADEAGGGLPSEGPTVA